MVIHKTDCTDNGIPSSATYQNPRLSRRFYVSKRFQRWVRSGCSVPPQLLRALRISSASSEIRTDTNPKGQVHRGRIRHPVSHSVASSRPLCISRRQNQTTTPCSSDTPVLDVPTGRTDSIARSHHLRPSPPETFSALDKLSPAVRSRHDSLHLTGSTSRSRMVAPRSDHLTGSSSYQEPTGTSHVYRCIPDGMGRPSSRSTDSGSLASRDHRPYQCLRAESCSTCHRQLERSTEKQACLYCHGQCHSSCLYPKDGRHTVTTDDVLDQTAIPIDLQSSDHLISQTHSRQDEHHSRRSIETRQDNIHRMVSTSIGIQVDIPTVGNTSDRSVCNSPKPSTSGLLQPTSGSASVSGRCFNSELEQHDSLCISSNQPDTGSTSEMPYSQHDTVPGGSSLAGETVVPRPPVSTDRPAAPTANMADVTEATELRSISQQSSNVQSSRLETIQQHMETAGFSAQVSEAVSKSVRPSTSSLYDFKWQRFQQWRVRERRDKQPVSIPMVADFLLYLRLKQKLRHNTLEGYRSALASVLDKQGFNMGTDKVLHDLLRSFEISDITTPRIPLKWDLSVVLSGLMRRPFEPMESAGLPHVAWKTAFLLALATAARVSELHAIDVTTISFPTEPHKAVFKLLPDFMAKNQKASMGPLGERAYLIPALSPTLSKDMPDRLLCPVRALKWYLKRTQNIRKDRRRLWISCIETTTKDITKSTVASWLKKAIKLTYQMAEQKPPILSKLKPHEIRAIATSLAAWKVVSIEQIVASCQWASQNTFTTFYMRDVAPDLTGTLFSGTTCCGTNCPHHLIRHLVASSGVTNFAEQSVNFVYNCGNLPGDGFYCTEVVIKKIWFPWNSCIPST